MPLEVRFSNHQLTRIMDEASIYLCACPAQLCRQIMGLRDLFAYQEGCLSREGVNAQVHDLIAESTRLAHVEMENCLDKILTIEGWDRQTFSMPEGLRQLRDEYLKSLDE